ncbi:MAG TPA: hypothetical protein VGL92_01065 [Acidimicrobiia bacterium]
MALNRRNHPDPSTAERLVAGRVGADDAPPGYRRVATLLGDAGSGFPEPAAPVQAETVSAMVAAIQAQPTPQITSRRSAMLSKILAVKTIAVAGVLALSASGAAAATGHLPDSVQDTVANAAKHVGVNLPHGKGVVRVTENCEPAGKDADGNDTFAKNRGQYLKQERAKSPEALAAAEKSRCGMPIQSKGTPGADDADETPEAPEAPENNGKAGEDHGKSTQDHGKAGEDHGAPADTPAAVETPNPGGIDAGGDAGDEANDTGAEHANPAAGDGSANSDDHPTAEDLPTPDSLPGAGS